MRTQIVFTLACLMAMAAASVSAQDASQATGKSDSWERPASASSVSYQSSPASVRDSGSDPRFKPREDARWITVESQQRPNGRPKTLCQQNPTASTCR